MLNTMLTFVAAALMVGTAAPAGAGEETVVRPGTLDRGPAITIPHLEGKTLVDGDLRIRVDAGHVRFLGMSGRDYLVAASNRLATDHHRTLRFTPERAKKVLLRGVPTYTLTLSDDGRHLVSDQIINHRRTRVRVFDSRSGDRVAGRIFGGFLDVLDADENRMLLGGFERPGTIWWNHHSNGTARLLDRAGYAADISEDRVASYTRDPYRGGCTVVSTISTRQRLWTSCRERVMTFSPDGRRMATAPLLADGLGPGDVWVRRAHGRALAHYSARWFGAIFFENGTQLLLEAYGTEKAATVRCELTDCERVSRLRNTPSY